MTVGHFEKVSFEQYCEDMREYCPDPLELREIQDMLRTCWEEIEVPTRATSGSAGYDFKAPFDFEIEPGDDLKVPTGIKVHIDDGWFLAIVPRSGLGFKYKLRLANTIGIIDSDYIKSDNEGHIFIKLCNEGGRTLSVKAGDGIAQGIFLPYGLDYADTCDSIRNGGFGSTD